MKPLRILSINLGLPALVPLLLLVSACGDDAGDSTQGTGGSGGSGVGGASGGIAGASMAGAATAGAPTAGALGSGGSAAGAGAPAGGSAGTSGGSAGTGAAAGTGGATAGNGGNPSAGGGASGGVATSGNGGNAGAPGGAGGKAGSGGAGAGGATGGTGGASGFTLSSPAFDNNAGCGPMAKDLCDVFPRKHTNFGTGTDKNVSPAFNWTGAPAGTQSFAIVMQDLSFNNTGHWVIWNIPASVSSLPEGLPSGAMLTTPVMANQTGLQGASFFGSGACGNVYEFVIYALSQANVTASGNPAAVRTTIQGLGPVILGQTNIRARSAMPECG